jgi:hypothetical protein
MAYAEIERIGRELNSMFYSYAYGYGQDMHHHHPYDESTSSSASSSLVDEMAMNMESLSVSAMDDLDWSEELPTSSSSSSSTLPSSHAYHYASKSPTSMADESCSKSFYFEDWATRLIGTPPTEMDLDGMKCSAVENSPQQPCKALR